MPQGLSQSVLWVSGLILEGLVCILAIRRGLFGRLPTFTTYLVLVLARDLWGFWLSRQLDYRSAVLLHAYWGTQAIVLLARGVAIGEICRRSLQPYRGVWALAWRLLVLGASILLLHAAWVAWEKSAWFGSFVLSAERGLELAAVVVLVLLLTIWRYYDIRVEPILAMVALGLGLYSAVQVANNSFMGDWLTKYFHWWDAVRVVSFQVAVVVWCLALRKPLPALRPRPVLLEQRVYDELAPQVSYRLRELNDRLREMLW